MKASQQSLTRRLRRIFQRHSRRHDPLLVFNLSIFNFADEWTRTLNRLKAHERGT